MAGKSKPQKPLYKKWWFWVIVIPLIGGLGYGLFGGGESGEPPTGQTETQAPATSAPEVPETLDDNPGEITPEPVATDPDSYIVPLGGADITIRRHEVRSGSGDAILDIGVGETTAEALSVLSSDELSAFVAALDFDGYNYQNIVLSLDDGTGLVFQKGLSSLTADYGYIDVGPGNFEITERQGAIWNEGEGWYYMTIAEMEAEDSAG